MNSWKTYRLGAVISIKSGFAYKGEYLGKGDKYLLGMGCVSFNEKFLPSGARLYSGDVPSRYFVKAGDIVLATRQQSDNLPILGMPAIIPSTYKNTFVGANLYAVQNDSDIDNNYLYWLLKTPEYIQHIKSCQTGTTVRMITKSNIESFEFKCPNRIERNRISNFLWSLENKIENNRRINTNLELQAQALYKQWFVDNRNDDWETLMLDDVATLSAGGDKPQIYSEQKTPECNIPIYSNGIDNEGLYGYTNNPRITKDSITISARGTIGFVSLRTEPYVPIVRLISVVPTYKNMSAYFLYLWALTQNISGTGTTQQQLTVPAFRTTKIVVPSQNVLIKFNQVVKPIFDSIKQNKKENETLATLRDTLLPKLMNGEIKISEI